MYKRQVEDIPEPDVIGKENVMHGSILPVLNKKLIANSINILCDLLQKSKNKALIQEVSSFLMLAVYRVFRVVYSANPKDVYKRQAIWPCCDGRWKERSALSAAILVWESPAF